MIIKWTNRTSKETGYIRCVDYKGQYFINTYDIDDAKKFNSIELALKMIDMLISYGEGIENQFEVIQ